MCLVSTNTNSCTDQHVFVSWHGLLGVDAARSGQQARFILNHASVHIVGHVTSFVHARSYLELGRSRFVGHHVVARSDVVHTYKAQGEVLSCLPVKASLVSIVGFESETHYIVSKLSALGHSELALISPASLALFQGLVEVLLVVDKDTRKVHDSLRPGLCNLRGNSRAEHLANGEHHVIMDDRVMLRLHTESTMLMYGWHQMRLNSSNVLNVSSECLDGMGESLWLLAVSLVGFVEEGSGLRIALEHVHVESRGDQESVIRHNASSSIDDVKSLSAQARSSSSKGTSLKEEKKGEMNKRNVNEKKVLVCARVLSKIIIRGGKKRGEMKKQKELKNVV
jgi:hypothetical protein